MKNRRDLAKTQSSEFWEAIDNEIQERKQESPLFKKLLGDGTDTIAEAVRASLDGLRDEMLSLIEPIAQLTEGWHRWGESIESQLDSVKHKAGALEDTISKVAGSAQEAMEHLRELQLKSQSDWSDWSLVDSEEYQELKSRAEALAAGNPSVPVFRCTDSLRGSLQ